MKVSLATALKIKKRYADKLDEMFDDIKTADNLLVYDPKYPQTFDCDILSMLEKYKTKVEKYNELSYIITKTSVNCGVNKRLSAITQLKQLLSWANNLQIKPVRRPLTDDGIPYDYKVQIGNVTKKELVDMYTKVIYKLQDEIDDINAKTTIDIPDELLD